MDMQCTGFYMIALQAFCTVVLYIITCTCTCTGNAGDTYYVRGRLGSGQSGVLFAFGSLK